MYVSLNSCFILVIYNIIISNFEVPQYHLKSKNQHSSQPQNLIHKCKGPPYGFVATRSIKCFKNVPSDAEISSALPVQTQWVSIPEIRSVVHISSDSF